MTFLRSFLLPVSIFLVFFGCAKSFPFNEQLPLKDDSRIVPCEDVGKFSTRWFLLNTREEYRKEISQKALFYTRNTTRQARELACSQDQFVTIWDIWPEWLYNDKNLSDNRMRCIHNDNLTVRTTFYENMSRAYARMARKTATVMHLNQDYDRPPLDGIWGRIELPTIRKMTDIIEVTKISEDKSKTLRWLIPRKGAREACERAMQEVRRLFRRARKVAGSGGGVHARAETSKRSSCVWYPDSDSFMDGLW